MNPGDLLIIVLIGLLMYVCIRSLINDRKNGVPSCGAKSCSSCGVQCGMYKACEVIANRKKERI